MQRKPEVLVKTVLQNKIQEVKYYSRMTSNALGRLHQKNCRRFLLKWKLAYVNAISWRIKTAVFGYVCKRPWKKVKKQHLYQKNFNIFCCRHRLNQCHVFEHNLKTWSTRMINYKWVYVTIYIFNALILITDKFEDRLIQT